MLRRCSPFYPGAFFFALDRPAALTRHLTAEPGGFPGGPITLHIPPPPTINIAEFHINVKFDVTCVHTYVNIDSRLMEEVTREELAWELEHVFSRSEIERG